MTISLNAFNEVIKDFYNMHNKNENETYTINGRSYYLFQLKQVINSVSIIREHVRNNMYTHDFYVVNLIKLLQNWNEPLVKDFTLVQRWPSNYGDYKCPEWFKHIGIDVTTKDLYPITEKGEAILEFLQFIELQVSLGS